MDVVDAIDDAEISGSIIILLQEGLAFVKRHSRKMWQKTADGRLEMPDYPKEQFWRGLSMRYNGDSIRCCGSKMQK